VARRANSNGLRVVEQKRAPTAKRRGPNLLGAEVQPVEYHDFVLRAERVDAASIELSVVASPTGTSAPEVVPFRGDDARRLRASFATQATWRGQVTAATDTAAAGQMLITQGEAIQIGRELAAVVFTPTVCRLFSQSLAQVVQKRNGGLRLRLAFDSSLVDLAWEYLVRPDRPHGDGVSAFLLLDPRISLVRQAADPNITIAGAPGKQQLAFVGTLWEGGVDGWEVRKEFALLSDALRPIRAFLASHYIEANDIEHAANATRLDIFQYAGHCDFDALGRAFLLREMPQTRGLHASQQVYLEDLAPLLRRGRTRLAVMSACNSGFWNAVKPLLDAGIPAVLGVNGGVASVSTIEFCVKLYDSLAVGLSLDEAVTRARLHVMEWGAKLGLFDWGLFMVYLPSPNAVLFPKAATPSVVAHQARAERERANIATDVQQLARDLDGLNFGEILSELSRRRVLILGRFSGRRLRILEALKDHLATLPNSYVPELFTFEKPASRDLLEAIVAFAGLSRFIIADLSEAKSVPSELEAIVPSFPSVPVVPIINARGREFATFAAIGRRENVVRPILRYKNIGELLDKVTREGVPRAEAKLAAWIAGTS